MIPANPHQRRFVAALEDFVKRQDRAALAAIRRGLGKPPGQMPEMDRYVVPWLPGDQPGRDDEAYYMVAALFAAWHQGRGMLETFEGNLGRSLRSIADRVPGHAAGLERRVTGVERRVIGLLAAHREELPTHLRHAISLLRTHSVPVDWIRLLADLPRWDHPDRIVQRRWARDFWRIDATSEPEGAIPSDLEAGNR